MAESAQEPHQVRSQPSGDWRPVPDPSELTRIASDRLETTMRELIRSEIEHLDGLLTQKLVTVQQQFMLLDARTAEQKQDTTNALNAALAAQKEAVAAQTASSEKSITKSETATTERIKGVETLLATGSKATDDKIADIKDRVVAIESVKLGGVEGSSITQTAADSKTLIETQMAAIATKLEGLRSAGAGAGNQLAASRAATSQTLAIIGSIAVVASILITVILATRH